jgi:3-oxoacyl-[acyl-carrier-protein] synthase II
LTPSEAWNNALEGRSGIDRISLLDPADFTSQVAGQVKGFDPVTHFGAAEARKSDRFTQFARVASLNAWNAAGFADNPPDPERVGVILGSGVGGIGTFEEQMRVAMERGPRRISPFFVPMMISNMACGQVAIDLNAKALNYCTVTACASSGHALATALDSIRLGRADVILAGGSEAPITFMALGGFCALKALSTSWNDRPTQACRPFDRDRDGFVMAEGGAILILEELSHAKARGAEIIAEIVGAGMTCDAFHITAPAEGGEGSRRAMINAMRDGCIDPAEVGYINAHGTSTQLNDVNETTAIINALGEQNARRIMVSSTKSVHGHMLGAAGSMEAALTCLALKHGVVPPTINHENPGEGCVLDYVPGSAREAGIHVALSNSLGFGGHNVTLAFRKFTGS